VQCSSAQAHFQQALAHFRIARSGLGLSRLHVEVDQSTLKVHASTVELHEPTLKVHRRNVEVRLSTLSKHECNFTKIRPFSAAGSPCGGRGAVNSLCVARN
jgi:hypothetical protein